MVRSPAAADDRDDRPAEVADPANLCAMVPVSVWVSFTPSTSVGGFAVASEGDTRETSVSTVPRMHADRRFVMLDSLPDQFVAPATPMRAARSGSRRSSRRTAVSQ